MRNARVGSATSVRGNKHTRGQEQAPELASSQLASQRSQTPSGGPPSGIQAGIEVTSTGVSQTVAPPTPSQDGASQNMETMVQGLVKSSPTQLGVIPQKTPDQSQAQSHTGDLDSPQLEDITSEGIEELLMGREELEDYDSLSSPVINETPLWKFAEQTPMGSQAQIKTKAATTQAQPATSTSAKPAAPQIKAPAQAKPQAPAQA